MKKGFRCNLKCWIFLIILFNLIKAQGFDTLWTKTYGGTLSDVGFSIAKTFDNKFVLTGYTNSFGVHGPDYYILKIDENGEILWPRTYGGIYRDEAYSIAATSDSGAIVCGWSSSFVSGRNIWIVKLDSLGDTLWTKLHRGQGYSFGRCIRELYDGNYMVCGYRETTPLLLKLNTNGDTIWAKHYGWGQFFSFLQTQDSGFIAVGIRDISKLLIQRVNKYGDSLWAKTYRAETASCAYHIASTSDNGYIVSGYTWTGYDYNGYILRLNSYGDTLWTKVYGGTGNEIIYSVIESEDQCFLATGYTSSYGAGAEDIWLLKLNAQGDTLWTKTIGDTGAECAHSILKASDNSYLILGYTTSWGAGWADFYLLKLESQTGVVYDLSKPSFRRESKTIILNGPIPQKLLKDYRIFDCVGRKVTKINSGIYFLIGKDNRVRKKLIRLE
ncbi:MAG: hypothetical protein ABIL46_07480 [candidate division WOR-3 bacterium]